MRMQKSELDVAKILIYDERKSRTTVSVFLSSPTPLEEANLGRLFILSEIESTDRESENIITIVEEEIAASYYGSADFNIEVAFENALAKTNSRLHQVMSGGHTDWLEKFSTVVAVIKEGGVHFTHLGQAHTFLIHNKQIVDILGNAQTSQRVKINPLKIFSNIISGNLREGDSLLFCTASLLDYLSLEKLRKTVDEHAPKEAAQYLQALLMENTINATFGSIIMKLVPKKDVMVESTVYGEGPQYTRAGGGSTPDESMSTLISQEQHTRSLLEPSLVTQVTKSLSSLGSTVTRLIGRGEPERKNEQDLMAEDNLLLGEEAPVAPSVPRSRAHGVTAPPLSRKVMSILQRLGSAIAHGIGQFFLWVFARLKNVRKERPRPTNYIQGARRVPRRTSQGAASLLLRLLNIPRRRKLILLIAIALLVVFSWTIVNQGERKEQQTLRDQYNADIITAKQKVGEADAALIYENEEDARALLIEAKNLVSGIPDDEELKDEKTKVLGDIDTRLVDVNHVVDVQPTLIADVANGFPEAALTGLGKLGSSYYSVDSRTGVLYHIASDGTVLDVDRDLAIDGSITQILEAPSSLLLLSSTRVLAEFAEPATFTKREILFATQDVNISSGVVYNGNLYLLDSQGKHVLKHIKTGANYGEGVQWIKDSSVDVSRGSAISVDGSMYIGTSDGKVMKLFQGNIDPDFKLSTIEPKFGAVKEIVADESVQNLYALDRENARVVVLSKDGKFVKQYRSDTFDRLEAMHVDEGGGTVTVVNNTSLYSFPL
ncbi:MAG: hypothetical protein HYV34_04435 [Candidatus Kerfeldbacteria bacterium]|nr:hypothetical protein [Candidatus Kerfeldbacteria bacterium]